jgi:hypothetical protein
MTTREMESGLSELMAMIWTSPGDKSEHPLISAEAGLGAASPELLGGMSFVVGDVVGNGVGEGISSLSFMVGDVVGNGVGEGISPSSSSTTKSPPEKIYRAVLDPLQLLPSPKASKRAAFVPTVIPTYA